MAFKLCLNLSYVASKLGLDLGHVTLKPKAHMPNALNPNLHPTTWHLN
jgi:hypothetical protein